MTKQEVIDAIIAEWQEIYNDDLSEYIETSEHGVSGFFMVGFVSSALNRIEE